MVRSYSLGSYTLEVGSLNVNSDFSGVIQNAGISAGPDQAGSLLKEGTGTLTLSGPNTHTGETTVDAGTLVVNGSIADSKQTTVKCGATLSGTGTVGPLQVNSGGVFAPCNGTPFARIDLSLSKRVFGGPPSRTVWCGATRAFGW
jgi:autotransporter-associated beta strand protein